MDHGWLNVPGVGLLSDSCPHTPTPSGGVVLNYNSSITAANGGCTVPLSRLSQFACPFIGAVYVQKMDYIYCSSDNDAPSYQEPNAWLDLARRKHTHIAATH